MIFSLTRPEIIKEIHSQYLKRSWYYWNKYFCSTSIAQSDYNLQTVVYDINFESVESQRSANEFTNLKPRFVGKSNRPTNRTSSISPDVEILHFEILRLMN